ncbi:GNAT family N-acetyltransferase [uncultured Jannaschia sp.]|uniref:GNAT family N-acetyltransferase n=1 Tax=uncultured Jannaschia sp. TaxID=293347 RepID=UPI002608D631|nr:GNAT family N-acetyltransferase [uncultured Jannaschia sp.]
MGSPFIQHIIQVRPAARADAPLLARLADLAGEGLPRHLWARDAAPGQDPLEVGTARARRDSGAFSWPNARIATWHGAAVGGIVDYDLDDVEAGRDVPALLAPLLELEALSGGTRYINILAVLPQARRRGIAAAIVADVAARTRRDLSLIVASENRTARGFYVGSGFDEVTSLAMGPGGPKGLSGNWILMRRPGPATSAETLPASGTEAVCA